MTDYLGLSQLAERVGISAVTAKSYMRDGRLPEPDATIGRVRGWLPSTIDQWQRTRPGRGRARLTSAELRTRLLAEIETQLPAGFVLVPELGTGGGCAATSVTAPDGRMLYVTDGDASLPYGVENDTDLYFGYYDSEGEEDGYLTMTDFRVDSLYWENVRVTVKAWVDGDPYRDIDCP